MHVPTPVIRDMTHVQDDSRHAGRHADRPGDHRPHQAAGQADAQPRRAAPRRRRLGRPGPTGPTPSARKSTEDTAYLDTRPGRVQAATASPPRAELAYGEPASEIVKWVEEKGCDLVAMSTHGHRFLADLVLGTTATASSIRQRAGAAAEGRRVAYPKRNPGGECRAPHCAPSDAVASVGWAMPISAVAV